MLSLLTSLALFSLGMISDTPGVLETGEFQTAAAGTVEMWESCGFGSFPKRDQAAKFYAGQSLRVRAQKGGARHFHGANCSVKGSIPLALPKEPVFQKVSPIMWTSTRAVEPH
jgi:hypothetical protein